jgi:hypothetical protein
MCEEERKMYSKFMKTLSCALAILFVASTLAFAGGQKNSGVIVAVAEKVVVIKGADGKTYEIEAVRVIAEDLKTGDIVGSFSGGGRAKRPPPKPLYFSLSIYLSTREARK